MSADEIRRPAVAGVFYPAGRDALLREIEGCYAPPRGPGAVPPVNEHGPRQIIGVVSPHAGYVYSGPAAAHAMAALAADGRPDAFVIIGPNHGRGRYVNAIQTRGAWLTPLGEAPIAHDLAGEIAAHCSGLEDGASCFVGEHSIEVQVPFLQHLYGPQVPIVPVMLLDQGMDAAHALGKALAKALAERNVAIVASTDMTHFESPHTAQRQDEILIERMEALDPEGLLRERERRAITMCGYGPVAAMLTAAKSLGAVQAQRLCYTNSGEVGPRDEVVAYLSLAVWKA
jgi:AmmeMemoRadiSam system protein B